MKCLFTDCNEDSGPINWDRADLDSNLVDLIKKDVLRTDRLIDYFHPEISDDDLELPHLKQLSEILLQFAAENPEIGYVQGMNEIAAPILYVMDNQVDAYAVFSHVMRKHVFIVKYLLNHHYLLIETLLLGRSGIYQKAAWTIE